MDKEALQEKRCILAQSFKKEFGENSHDEFSSTFKDSSLKKTGSLLKKLKAVQVEQLEVLLNEIKSVNLRMHLTEVTSSILENKPKSSTEIMGLVNITVSLMIEYPEFRQLFVLELLKRIGSEVADLDVSDKTKVNALRWILRLAFELHHIRVFNGQSKLGPLFDKLLLQDQEKGLRLITFATYFLKNFDFLTTSLHDSTSILAGFDGLGEVYEKYYKSMCRHVATLHHSFLKNQDRAKQFYESKGDLSSQFAAELTESYDKFEDAYSQLESLSALMNKDLPQLSDRKPKYEIIDGKIIFTGDLSFLQNKNAQIFEDEEQRLFYENLPQFERPEFVPDHVSPIVEEPELGETTIEEIDPDNEVKEGIRIPSAIESLVKDIDAIRSKEDADNIARQIVETCPSDLFTFADTLCTPMRKRMELVPYFARICAISASAHPKLNPAIIIGQFTFLLHKKDPIMGTRRRICRFIAEFTKFHLITQSQVYNCLKKCVSDFTGPNIDMFCMIIEHCGRFIYLQPESHARIAHLLKVANNKRMNSIDISSDRQINISNALFVVDPAPFHFNIQTVDQKEVYINFLMSSELDEHELTTALLQLDWNDYDTIKLLQEQFLQPWMHQIERADIHAKCLLRLYSYYPSIICNILERLMDNFLAIVEIASPLLPQQAVAIVELISRLYCLGLFDEKVQMALLYHLICYDHDLASGCTVTDGPDQHLRIKLVVSLLTPALSKLKANSWSNQLEIFLKLFRCYICSKIEISRENFELVTDLYQTAGLPLLPLNLDVAVAEFYQSDSSNLPIISKLDFLNQEAHAGSTYSGPIGKELTDAQNTEYLAELDREMAKLVCHGLEQRKLERRPQNYDIFIPLGLKASSSSGNFDASQQDLSSKINLMLKKGTKNKTTVLKPLGP